MIPKFKHNVKTFKGIDRSEDLVYCQYNDGELTIAKHLPKRKIYPENRNFGAISSNLHHLYESLSPEYKSDLATYTLMYRGLKHDPHKIPMSAYSIFTRMMWALEKQSPEIALLTITREDILKHEYPIRSIVEAMKSGMLFNIPEASMLNHEI